MKKGYLFAITHALPTAIVLADNGHVLCTHAGSDADDAKYWLRYHHDETTLKEVEVIELDQDLVEKNLYHGAPILSLGKNVANAFKLNQELKSQTKEAID